MLRFWKNSWIKVLILLTFVCAEISCATRGKDFPSDVSWIKKDTTKKSDVKTLLGEPYQVGYASGSPTWTYGYYKFRLFGSSHSKELKFYWNQNATVENFSFTSSFSEDVKKGVIQQSAGASPAPSQKSIKQ